MSLPHALLTSIAEKPCSGYDLARRFDKSIGYFWHATHQQIYRELARMETQGWVISKEVEGGRAGKKLFDIQAAGREELKRWASENSIPMRWRDDMMVKLRADAAIGPLGLEEEFERRLQMHEQELQNYRNIEQRDFSNPQLSREAQLRYLILKAGITFEQSRVQWTKEALQVLRNTF
ncbi:PadR family transcriptional regulator [Undibacterium sp. CY18W]|uniref:PadR family transcriptional regulator n=1 Tax=Undibacterium hunanense TaxID=2762292 RepID=A0ABR6ZSR3_9BURK|nr:PadR family transcriptional regulator [Undibacterium hunanense]MBC3918555.1 PadR family transcriptional regulator [Undibacterium hunanense]